VSHTIPSSWLLGIYISTRLLTSFSYHFCVCLSVYVSVCLKFCVGGGHSTIPQHISCVVLISSGLALSQRTRYIHISLHLCIYIYIYLSLYIYVYMWAISQRICCACLFMSTHLNILIFQYGYIYMYIHIYLCICELFLNTYFASCSSWLCNFSTYLEYTYLSGNIYMHIYPRVYLPISLYLS